jgi:hypothetical protein
LAPTGRIFLTFDIWAFFWKSGENSGSMKNPTRIMGTLHEDQYTFVFVTCSVLPRMRNVSDKSGGEYENTHCMFSIFFFFFFLKILPFMRECGKIY